MISYTYDEFVKLLDNDNFLYASFEIIGYPHYKHCIIQKIKPAVLNGMVEIVFTLSSRRSEKISFLEKFNESYKLFYLGRKLGTFTLKQLWNRIKFYEVKM